MKKILLTSLAAAILSFAGAAQADTITNTYDPSDVSLAAFTDHSSINFTQSIVSNIGAQAPFVVGRDLLNSAKLSIYLKDNGGFDIPEIFVFSLGSLFTQAEAGAFGFFQTSLVDTVNFNGSALADLRSDGSIGITITALTGSFKFDKSVLTADVTHVPEPSSIALLGLGMLGFAAARKKRKTV